MSVELFLKVLKCLRYFILENGSELSHVFKQAVQRHIEAICSKQKAHNEIKCKYKVTSYLKQNQWSQSFIITVKQSEGT